jgi:hypothetical protein
MSYSFINPIQGGGETEDGFLYDYGYSDEEWEAKLDSMTDPTLDQDPLPSDPVSIYPARLGGDPELIKEWELATIGLGMELPPLRLLPEGSLLRAEWFRRAKIIKKQRKRQRAWERRHPNHAKDDDPIPPERALALLEDARQRGLWPEGERLLIVEAKVRELQELVRQQKQNQ